MPEDIASFITNNNYGNDCYVADIDGTSNSADGLSFDDVDEIDTNSMEIYSGAPIKRERLAEAGGTKKVQQQAKREPENSKTVEQKRKAQSSTKSLLIPSKNEQPVSNDPSLDADLMLNLMGDLESTATNIDGAGTSGMAEGTSDTATQNLLFDEIEDVSGNFNFDWEIV